LHIDEGGLGRSYPKTRTQWCKAVQSILEHLGVHATGYLLGITLILTAVLLLRLTIWRRRPPPSNELFR